MVEGNTVTDKKIIARMPLVNGGELVANSWANEDRFNRTTYSSEIVHSPSMTQLLVFQDSTAQLYPVVLTALVQGFTDVFNRFDATVVDSYIKSFNVLTFYGDSGSLRRIQSSRAYGVGELLTCILVQVNRNSSWYNFRELPDNAFDRLHLSRFAHRGVSTLRDMNMMLNPRDFQYGEDQFDFMFAFAGKADYDNNLSSPDFREIVRCFCSVESLGYKAWNVATKLRDIERVPDHELDGGGNVPQALRRLPLKTKKYRDYLLDLPVSKIATLLESDYRFIKPNVSASGGIQLTESFLKPAENKINSAVLVHETYCAFFAKVDEIPESRSFAERYPNLLTRLYEKQANMNTMSVLKAHFEKDSEKLPWKELDKIVNMVLVPAQIKKWLSAPAQSESVISSLWGNIGEKTIEALLIATEEDHPFNPSQWMGVAEKYDDLKDVPVSWWASMVL